MLKENYCMKGNKLFIKSMIITAVIGLTALMAFMFVGIKYVTEQNVQAVEKGNEAISLEKQAVPFNSIILGVIKELSEDQISIFDIEKKQIVKTTIQEATLITDERDKAIPLSQIRLGDIIEIAYEPAKDNLLSIKKSSTGWIKTDFKNAKLDKPNRQIHIGANTYNYTENILVLDQAGNLLDNMHFVGDYDTLELKGIKNEVHSIKVLEQQGFIQLDGLPTREGTLEIDINRQINLEEISTTIPLSAGTHKIGIYLNGYEPLIKNIEITPGEILVVTTDDIEKEYYTLLVNVTNGDNQYVIDIDGKKYKPQDRIELLPGNYKLTITKKGFETYEQQISVEQSGPVTITLVPIQEIKQEETTSKEENNKEEQEEPVQANYKINISSNPEGASIYINGTHKGVTPYNTTLPMGDYYIELQKEGYETYSTAITIDNSDLQSSYLYQMISK